MSHNKDKTEYTLETLKGFVVPRLKKSLSLSYSEKQNLLARIHNTQTASPKRIVSPYSSFATFFKVRMQYGMYALPLIMIVLFANYSDSFSLKFRSWLDGFNSTKNEIAVTQSSIEAKMSLSKAQRGITELKSSDDEVRKNLLASQVSSRSQEVRNKVAALVKENKITEAKEIVLDLETALKADQLFAVAPAVAEEVFAATDLRVELEKQEVVNFAFSSTTATSTSVSELQEKLDGFSKELKSFDNNASTTLLIADAQTALDKAQAYLKENSIQEAVITLQAAERIVAEIRLVLLQ